MNIFYKVNPSSVFFLHSHKQDTSTKCDIHYLVRNKHRRCGALLSVLFTLILLFTAVLGHGADGALNGLVLGVDPWEILQHLLQKGWVVHHVRVVLISLPEKQHNFKQSFHLLSSQIYFTDCKVLHVHVNIPLSVIKDRMFAPNVEFYNSRPGPFPEKLLVTVPLLRVTV